ncbi:MAG: hypothetical protein IAG13_28495, partial [Deltaproteobacteria bacterium]|nr:hypothetical protein [Nannocystaceae bacterium]
MTMQSPDARPSRALRLYAMILLLPACGDRGDGDGSGGTGDAFGGEIEFRGEQPLLPGLDLDSGWFPEGLQ